MHGKLAVALLDLVEHPIEAVNQVPQLIVGGLFGADRVIAVDGDVGGGAAQVSHRASHETRQPGGQQQCDHHGPKHDRAEHDRVPVGPRVQRVQVRRHVRRPDHLPVEVDRAGDLQAGRPKSVGARRQFSRSGQGHALAAEILSQRLPERS